LKQPKLRWFASPPTAGDRRELAAAALCQHFADMGIRLHLKTCRWTRSKGVGVAAGADGSEPQHFGNGSVLKQAKSGATLAVARESVLFNAVAECCHRLLPEVFVVRLLQSVNLSIRTYHRLHARHGRRNRPQQTPWVGACRFQYTPAVRTGSVACRIGTRFQYVSCRQIHSTGP
jgi:hypothetical protein